MIESSNMPHTEHDKPISTRSHGDLGSDVIRNSLSSGSVNNSNSSNFDRLLGKCQTCLAFNSKKNKPKVLLTNLMEWKVEPLYLCKFPESAMEALRAFKPNITDIFCCSEFDKFISFRSNMLLSLTIERSFLNHVPGALIQVLPALMLQQSSTVWALNIDAISK